MVEYTDYKLVNEAFMNKVFEGSDEMIKEAEEQFSNMIRTYFRENGILRRAMEPMIIAPNAVDRLVDTDNPGIIFDIQPDSAAYSVPFNGEGPVKRFEGKRAVAMFTTLSTEVFKMEKQRIVTYSYPVEEVLIQQGVKDIMKAEDEIFVDLLDTIATNESLIGNVSGVTGGINEKLKEAVKLFRASRPANRQIPISTIICNENTYSEFMSLPATVYATQFNEDILRGGVSNLERPFGYNWVVTNKRDLVPDNTMYLLAPRQYLGGFFLFEKDATTFIKKEHNFIELRTYETPAISIVNSGLFKVTI